MMRRFVSAGWPYLYDVPGLHNCVPMIMADVAARHGRMHGEDVYYLCGSDDHGSRVEFVSQGYGLAPDRLIRDKREITIPLLRRLGLGFDQFGQTSDPRHKRWVQDAFIRLRERGFLQTRALPTPWCERCNRSLPDRFVEGRCPHCGGRAYGNQCEAKQGCDRLLSPEMLVEPRCAICQGPTTLKSTLQWVVPIASLAREATRHVTSSATYRDDVRRIVEQTIEEQRDVVVTRDVRWGIPLPWSGGTETVYNWVDSLLAKVSHVGFEGRAREDAFWRDPDARKMFFLGRDGVSFYGVLFPSLLAALDLGHCLENWIVVPNEVFIYEGGVCSKSTGTGIWLAEALDTLPAEHWRFYVLYAYANRNGAERDVDFRWDRLCDAVKGSLVDPLERVLARVRETDTRGSDAAVAEAHAVGRAADDQLAGLRIGTAFRTVLGALGRLAERMPDTTPRAAAVALEKLLPVLGCYVPETMARTMALLGGSRPGDRLFPAGPLVHRDVQRAYQDRVAARRNARSLEEELTDARADALCVCPIHLGER